MRASTREPASTDQRRKIVELLAHYTATDVAADAAHLSTEATSGSMTMERASEIIDLLREAGPRPALDPATIPAGDYAVQTGNTLACYRITVGAKAWQKWNHVSRLRDGKIARRKLELEETLHVLDAIRETGVEAAQEAYRALERKVTVVTPPVSTRRCSACGCTCATADPLARLRAATTG
ncbi:hypothetical protein AB0I28_32885 [Phytomonospora sp. NPDC050363]|uniref:hypothetical protein n=1 Tax=Phytomonospora sp. NPDC050363 TaxID=3155642 RepID=UPI0033E274F4